MGLFRKLTPEQIKIISSLVTNKQVLEIILEKLRLRVPRKIMQALNLFHKAGLERINLEKQLRMFERRLTQEAYSPFHTSTKMEINHTKHLIISKNLLQKTAKTVLLVELKKLIN